MKALRFDLAVALFATFTALAAPQAAEILDAKKVVPEFVAMGLKPKVVKLVDPRFKELSYKEDKYYLDVRFGKITQDQFTKLKAYFGNVSSVPYSNTREYDIIDFVQPSMQAVANQTFEVKSYDTSFIMDMVDFANDEAGAAAWGLSKSGLSSFTNCWNTSWELTKLRHPKSDPRKTNYVLYWPGRWTADDILKDKKHSDLVPGDRIKAGDMLIVSNKGPMSETAQIQHTALVLTKNLVFEKTDSGDNDPYRISLRADVLAKYREVFEKAEVIEYRRFNGAGKMPLPEPIYSNDDLGAELLKVLKQKNPTLKVDQMTSGCETGLGGGCDLTFSEAHPMKVVLNPKTGRGILMGDKAALNRFKPLRGR